MDYTATVLHYIYSLQFMWLLATLIIQPASPFGAGVVCQQVPGLEMTEVQKQMCTENPKVIPTMFEHAVRVFKHHCHTTFKHEKWTCRGINPPMFATVEPFLGRGQETKEAAFVYALTSAAVVHTIADKLSQDNTKCASLDRSLLPEGQKWVGCSPDVHYSIWFAKNFMDSRVSNESMRFRTFVERNSEIGRLAVLNYMRKSCEHVGGVKRSDSCVWELPTMERIVEILRKKYEESVQASIVRTSARPLLIVDKRTGRGADPTKLLCFSASPDYCERNDDLKIHGVSGRVCTMEDGAPNSCSNLCCESGYQMKRVIVQKTCNCDFVWCCHVKCQTCKEEVEQTQCI